MKNEKLKTLRTYFNLKQSEMAAKIGIKPSSYSSIENGANDLTTENLKKLHAEFGLNPTWYLTGEGEMIVGEQGITTPKYEIIPLDKKLGITIDKQFILPISGSAQAGYIVGYSDDELYNYYEIMRLPFSLDNNVRGFRVHGDSMANLIMHNDVVVCQRVIDLKHHFFKPTSYYVLVCADGVVVKYASKTEAGFRLRSENGHYSTYIVEYNEVLEVWKVEIIMKYAP